MLEEYFCYSLNFFNLQVEMKLFICAISYEPWLAARELHNFLEGRYSYQVIADQDRVDGRQVPWLLRLRAHHGQEVKQGEDFVSNRSCSYIF